MQQSERNCYGDQDGVKIKTKPAESKSFLESKVSDEGEMVDGVEGPGHASPLSANRQIRSIELSDINYYSNKDEAKWEDIISVVGEIKRSNLQDQFLNQSCEESDSVIGRSEAEVVCNVFLS